MSSQGVEVQEVSASSDYYCHCFSLAPHTSGLVAELFEPQ